ncbi:uncharacterized protein A4U43_C04F10200 [Asparagus officinalis]|uniref:4-coumarate--CoA ligase n=1 Tax=Asparagus officinalis TaxID=4686 RepID=A0A5P1F0G3_ASPOF|nr:4-coumarate--CoA ligase 2-like [Asparagus officinalis]ONK71584.1 uncharacterized protein A4U43_C04F10200 [Asparagus officinalis]
MPGCMFGAKLVVTQSAYIDRLPKIDDLIVITIDDPMPGCMFFGEINSADENDVPDVSIDPDDAVAMPFSSGTTGLPKGVVLTHPEHLCQAWPQQVDGENPNLWMRAGEDVMLCVLPMFHIFRAELGAAVRDEGGARCDNARFEMERMLEAIER